MISERQKDRLCEKLRPKMQEDPLFHQCVDEVVATVNIEGGHKKPEWRDLFAFQLLIFPYTFYNWCCKMYRRHISAAVSANCMCCQVPMLMSLGLQPLGNEEKLEMAKEAVGLGTWDVLTPAQRDDLVAKEIWRYDVQEKMAREARGEVDNDEELIDEDEVEGENDNRGKKAKKRLNKKKDKKNR
jgi:hypothetical protein